MNIPDEAITKAAEALNLYVSDDFDAVDVDGQMCRTAARTVLEAATPFIAAQALLDAADEMSGVIATGDVAECAAPVPGESGRQDAIWARDGLYEEPDAWLRRYAESESDS